MKLDFLCRSDTHADWEAKSAEKGSSHPHVPLCVVNGPSDYMGLKEVGEVEWIQICILIWQRILDQAMSILLGSAQIQSSLEGSDHRV